MDNRIIEGYLIDYLRKAGIELKKVGGVLQLQCPFCKKPGLSAIIPPKCNFVNCFSCQAKKKTIFDIVKVQQKLTSDEEVLQYLKEFLKLNIITKKDAESITDALTFYKENALEMVVVEKNGKRPIEKDWVNKVHNEIEEWKNWLNDGLNIGIKTGKKSNIVIIDVDIKPVPKEIIALVGDTFTIETTHGFQFYYKYVDDLPKTRINELKMDIETDGGQCVAYPSLVEGIQRKIINQKPIATMPKELHEYLRARVTVPLKSFSEQLKEDIQTENFNLNLLGEGERNVSLIKLGGLLRKDLNIEQTSRVLDILNRHICKNPISSKELNNMVKSLSKYTEFDEKELAHRVLTYLKDVEEAGRSEICSAIMGTNRGEEKRRIDKVLNYLVREQYILKKGHYYCIIKKLNWKDELMDIGVPVKFIVPYFDDIGHFNYEDLIIIGARNKVGKTHISINMIKRLVSQGVTPYLINLEKGGRFAKIALRLGLKEGDFHHSFCANPTQIELEKNAVTIIDWLLIENKAETDLIMKHFIEQLDKQGGFLIIFNQLKEDNSWFAPNMIKQFPALAVRYLYDDENDGTYGKFKMDVIREPKGQIKNFKNWEIACKYDESTKELKRIDELKDDEKIEIKNDTNIEIQETKNNE